MGAGHVHALYRHGTSPLHAMAPQVKLVAAAAFIVAVVATPRTAVWAFAGYFTIMAAVLRVGRVGPRFVLTRMVVLLPFLVAALSLPFIVGGDRWNGLSIDGLWALWNVTAKATLGFLASMALASTTEAPDVVRGLDALRVPRVMTAIMGFMLRYVDVIVGEISRMRIAMRARGYRPKWLGEAGAIGRGLAGVFVRSFERGERVYVAMASRGYTGRMPMGDVAAAPREWVPAIVLVAVTWALAATAVVMQ